jgi:hypothetical protein
LKRYRVISYPFHIDASPQKMSCEVRGTYLSYLRNLIFDEHVFIQLKEKRTVSRFYFYKRVGPDSPGETFPVLREKEENHYSEYRTRRLVLETLDRLCKR